MELLCSICWRISPRLPRTLCSAFHSATEIIMFRGWSPRHGRAVKSTAWCPRLEATHLTETKRRALSRPRDAVNMMLLEDAVDRRGRDVHLMIAGEEHRQPLDPELSLLAETQNPGLEPWWDAIGVDARPPTVVAKARGSELSVACHQKIELAAGNPKEPSRKTDVVCHLLLVLNDSQPRLDPPDLPQRADNSATEARMPSRRSRRVTLRQHKWSSKSQTSREEVTSTPSTRAPPPLRAKMTETVSTLAVGHQSFFEGRSL